MPSRQDEFVPPQRVGIADIIAFGDDYTYILRNSIDPVVHQALKDMAYNSGGWRVDKHLRFVADATGDKKSDFIGFGDEGVLISTNNGDNTFQPVRMVISDFAYNAGGWRIDKHPRMASDLRKTGCIDIIGFGNAGVLVSLNNGSLNFGPTKLALNDFGYDAGGWRTDRHLRMIGDTTGNGYPDIIGFGEQNVFVSANKCDGTFTPVKAVVHDMCYNAGGWRVDKHPRFVADLTGDNRVDLIGFGDAGVYVSLNNGQGGFGAVEKVVSDFGYNSGWRIEKHPRIIADISGNGCGDIVGFGDNGVMVSMNNGDGTFQLPQLVIKDFGYNAGGWRVEKHPRFVCDLTGDGRADILGFGENSVFVSFNLGNGRFGPVTKLVDNFTVGQGWSLDKHIRCPGNLNF